MLKYVRLFCIFLQKCKFCICPGGKVYLRFSRVVAIFKVNKNAGKICLGLLFVSLVDYRWGVLTSSLVNMVILGVSFLTL
jgi:hypothetical protein